MRIEEEIASIQNEIEQARISADKAADDGKTSDFQKFSSQEAMLLHRLEKVKAEQTAIVYPPITASEYKTVKKELFSVIMKIKVAKYQELLRILDQGQAVLHELDAAIKEYNSEHGKLHRIISNYETDADADGYEYPLYDRFDAVSIDKRLTEVFYDNPSSMHNFKNYIKNTMNRN